MEHFLLKQYRIPIQTREIFNKQQKIKTQVDGNKLCFSLTKVILPESKTFKSLYDGI